MAETPRRRRALLVLVLLIILLLLLLVFVRCRAVKPPATAVQPAPTPAVAPLPNAGAPAAAPAPPAKEDLTPAKLTVAPKVGAGAAFDVAWEGPDNPGDFVTIVKKEAGAEVNGNYRLTKEGRTLQLTAPIEPGAYEVRYVTSASRSILGRASIEVAPVGATLDAPAEVVLGAKFSVGWTGPDNAGDYITIVAAGAADEHYGSYTETRTGSPVTLTAPTETGSAEVRYVSGQGRKVLARRPIRVVAASVTLSAPESATAGANIEVAWTGPNNTGDYITAVAAGTPDGQYANYTTTSSGSPLKILLPIEPGDAELRYMTGQGNRVLARRPIRIVAAVVTLSAPTECKPGEAVRVTWTGPNNGGDYITIVAKDAADGRYGAYTMTSSGSPLSVAAPDEPGEAEIRYMTGQGGRVLARVPLRVAP